MYVYICIHTRTGFTYERDSIEMHFQRRAYHHVPDSYAMPMLFPSRRPLDRINAPPLESLMEAMTRCSSATECVAVVCYSGVLQWFVAAVCCSIALQ